MRGRLIDTPFSADEIWLKENCDHNPTQPVTPSAKCWRFQISTCTYDVYVVTHRSLVSVSAKRLPCAHHVSDSALDTVLPQSGDESRCGHGGGCQRDCPHPRSVESVPGDVVD